MKLRNYQSDLVELIYNAFTNGANGVVAVAPTGAGKMATLTNMAAQSNNRVLILFHVRELAEQCGGWLDNWQQKHDYIMAKKHFAQNERVTVATMQTYYRQRKKINHFYERIIIDEGHHVKANTYERIFDLNPLSKRIAFTATPIRLDGSGLVDNKYFDAMVEGLTALELVDMGYLAPIKLFSQPCDIDFSSVKTVAGDYDQKEVAKLLQDVHHGKIMGDAIKYYRQYVDGLPALACCSSVKHAEMVADEFNEAGIPAVAVHGKMDRTGVVEEYTDGKIKVLTYCQVFGEGVDLPDAVAMFYFRKTKSLTVWRQNCGRVARKPYEDKIAYVFDHVGQAYTNFAGEPMGHPYRNIDWLKLIYEQQERKISKSAKTPKIYERCDKCMMVYSAELQICPKCGYNSVLSRKERALAKKVAGELREFKEMEAIKSKKLSELTTIKELQTYGRIKGYKPQWAFMYWKNKNKRGRFKQNKKT